MTWDAHRTEVIVALMQVGHKGRVDGRHVAETETG